LDPLKLRTKGGGQVLGLGREPVQVILKSHGISQILAEEGGRTNRGGLGQMEKYVGFLNNLHKPGKTDLTFIESWWAEKVKEFFSAEGFILHYDTEKSVRAIVEDLLDQALKRQKASKGVTYVGAMLQHMVGAKLTLAMHTMKIEHRGYSVADAASEDKGDFILGDAVIHVTTAPSEALIRKCKNNIEHSLRPIVVTISKNVPVAIVMAEAQGIAHRVEVVDAGQFITTNLYELSLFDSSKRKITIDSFVAKYNEFVDSSETDPSLKIILGK